MGIDRKLDEGLSGSCMAQLLEDVSQRPGLCSLLPSPRYCHQLPSYEISSTEPDSAEHIVTNMLGQNGAVQLTPLVRSLTHVILHLNFHLIVRLRNVGQAPAL